MIAYFKINYPYRLQKKVIFADLVNKSNHIFIMNGNQINLSSEKNSKMNFKRIYINGTFMKNF